MARTREFDTDAALERAMEVFREKGYEGASTRDLTGAIGIGPGSLYAAFHSKEGLYLAALRRHCEHLAHTTQQALTSKRSARTVVRGLLQLAFTGSDPAHWGPGCLLLRAATERAGANPELDRMLRDASRAVEAAFAEILADGRRRGELPQDLDSAAAAHFLVTTLQGLRVMALLGSDRASLSATVETALRCLG
ncbi:TetR/AcrR family transcriptional regulator [Amycolatopsis granulosa]|uniref:TetR/AcrR family transcriptional regulator n=1 Tax=Amycolatopsis granulosa TaxID=185684 RepID=UPI0014211140|nr:TetR/AcrR family transcriptional regulator [Amycolatopsis granulosa]NIH84872.1 TetR/AcrR family transcriptional repressor of nem operon [Amycolatopsis granulosa]